MKQKPALILLHGALGCASQFEMLKNSLSDTFECETFDFTGHGKNSAGNAFRMGDLSEQLKTLILQKQLDHPFVFGYSMGGYAALVLELRQPGSLGALLTLGTKFRWNEEESIKESKMLNPEKIKEKVPAFAARLAALHGDLQWEQMLKETAEMMLDLGRNPLLDDGSLGQLHIPVCIGRGEQDHMVSQEESEMAAQALPRGVYREFSGMEHPIEKVDVARLSNEIRSFFSQ